MLTLNDKKLMKQNTEAMWNSMRQHREIAQALFDDPKRSHFDVLAEIARLRKTHE